MKRIIIVLLVLLLLGGGAGAALFFLEIGPFAPAEEMDGEGDDAGITLGPAPTYVNMQPLNIPILDGDTVVTTLQVELSLQVSEEKKEAVTHNLPRLRDAFLWDLYSYLPRVLRAGGRPDILVLKQHLMRVADKAIGSGMIEDVLVQSLVEAKSL
ncbi:MAG: hypothetical protein ACPGO3_13185 [Magnetospiraceae bacterium]